MKKTRTLLLLALPIFLLFACEKEQLNVVKQQHIDSLSIMNYFEFDNGDKWFIDRYGNVVFLNEHDTMVFNQYYNKFGSDHYRNIDYIYSTPNGQYIARNTATIEHSFFNLDIAAYKNKDYQFKEISKLYGATFLHYDAVTKQPVFLKEVNNKINFCSYDGENVQVQITDIPVRVLEYDFSSDNNQGVWTMRYDINHYYFLEHYTNTGVLVKQIRFKPKKSLHSLTIDNKGNLWGIDDKKICKLQGDSIVFIDQIYLNLPKINYYGIYPDYNDKIWFNSGSYHIYDIIKDTNHRVTVNLKHSRSIKLLIGKNYDGVFFVLDGVVYKYVNDQLIYIYGKEID